MSLKEQRDNSSRYFKDKLILVYGPHTLSRQINISLMIPKAHAAHANLHVALFTHTGVSNAEDSNLLCSPASCKVLSMATSVLQSINAAAITEHLPYSE